jgi:hypothetical protein
LSPQSESTFSGRLFLAQFSQDIFVSEDEELFLAQDSRASPQFVSEFLDRIDRRIDLAIERLLRISSRRR